MGTPKTPRDDFDAEDAVKQLGAKFDGRDFDDKVLKAIKDFKPIQDEISQITWVTLKHRILWIFLTGIGLLIMDFLIRLIPILMGAITRKVSQ